jgi:hypothetical protein
MVALKFVADARRVASRYGAVNAGNADLPGKYGRRVIVSRTYLDAKMTGATP